MSKAAHDTEAATTWQQAQREVVTDPAELLALLGLDHSLLPAAQRAAKLFPLRVPRSFVRRMESGNPNDPLLQQVLPLGAECRIEPGFVDDPTADQAAMAVPGLLHKYHGRALLITTGACGVHCRYCFRRQYPYADAHSGGSNTERALDYLREHTEISEIILSGGDPLTHSDEKLLQLMHKLEAIPHLSTLRIHSRQPVVIPERLTNYLRSGLCGTRFKIVLVLHVNHANELDQAVEMALGPYRDTGITLLNQTVLLKGINDNAEALARLSERLFDIGVLPYYLHQLDKVQGAGHFLVNDGDAKATWAELHARLPGYLVPKLVRETPGEAGKSWL